jgi:hypothetical protein
MSAAVQAQFNFQTKSKAKPRTKTKPAVVPALTDEQRERITNHLLANGWEPGWLSDAVILEVLRLEGRRKKCR